MQTQCRGKKRLPEVHGLPRWLLFQPSQGFSDEAHLRSFKRGNRMGACRAHKAIIFFSSALAKAERIPSRMAFQRLSKAALLACRIRRSLAIPARNAANDPPWAKFTLKAAFLEKETQERMRKHRFPLQTAQKNNFLIF